MAQLSMDPNRPPMVSLIIEVRDHSYEGVDRTGVLVKVGTGFSDPSSVASATLEGRMTDYLDTLIEDAVNAWHFQEEPRDVTRAVTKAVSLARRHARAHERQGTLRGV